MRIIIAFHDWDRNGKSIYVSEEGNELSAGDFHSGTVFVGSIDVDEDNAAELRRAIATKAWPVFRIVEVLE